MANSSDTGVEWLETTAEEAEAYRVQRLEELRQEGAPQERIDHLMTADVIRIRGFLDSRRREQAIEQAERERQRAEREQWLGERWLKIVGNRERYLGCRLENWQAHGDKQQTAKQQLEEFASRIEEHTLAGRNLLLYGTVGTGKDHAMVALLHRLNYSGMDPLPAMSWLRGIDITATAKEQLGRPVHRRYSDEWRPAVVAISDPALTGDELLWYARQRLYQIVDDAYADRTSVWLSVNASNRQQLEEMLSPQVVDRVADNCVAIHFDFPSHRKPWASQ